MPEMDFQQYRLYLVIGSDVCKERDLFSVVEDAVKGGVDLVQLREKNIPEDEFLKKAIMLKKLLDSYNVPLIINDSLFVARQSKAYGIHVGNSNGDPLPSEVRREWPECKMLGYSIGYKDQINSSEALCADYLAVSPVFQTDTKKDIGPPWGTEGLKYIRLQTRAPLVAIGGMKLDSVENVINAGADCISVVSAICSADKPGEAAVELRMEIEKSLLKRNEEIL